MLKGIPMRKLLWLGIASLLISSVAAAAQEKAPPLPHVNYTDQTLDNGLRVILIPDSSAPVLGIAITYNVGSRNERPGRTGFAHLFEHMMFQGSENVGKGEHFILLENNGGGLNGTTNEDRTNYFEIVPKNQLDLILFLESDRMAHLAVNQTNLDNQRNAVQEERRLGTDNQPYGKAELEVDNLTYDCFPYKHSTIGSMSDLNAASLDDIKDFFRIYYAPNNAVLTLSGDFDPTIALEKIKKYFASIPKQPTPPPVPPCEDERLGERRTTVDDPLARLPMVLIAYLAPPGHTPENFALQVLANILSTGQSSRLYQHIVKEKQLATSVEVQVDARRGLSAAYFIASPRPGIKTEDLEKAILEEIQAVADKGVTQEEIDKARKQYRIALVKQRESALSLAIREGMNVVYFNDPDLINTALDKFTAVTADDVKNAAHKYLVSRTRTVVYDVPQPGAQAAQGGAQ
jgi:predicted Zn-dependent peptidase